LTGQYPRSTDPDEVIMGLIFRDDLHDEFGTFPIAFTPSGGADFEELKAVGKAVGGGDDGAFYEAWTTAGAVCVQVISAGTVNNSAFSAAKRTRRRQARFRGR
jgi:hypothetical protein